MSSSWFGGSLSSLTDQITSFTKDVLSETTQEIEDPVTELQVATRQIEDLKKQTAQLESELTRLRKSNDDYRERAETAELQVGSNKDQYLKLLQQRESEIEKLREQLKEMKDQQRKIVMSTRSDSNLLSLTKDTPAVSFDREHQMEFSWPEEEGGVGGGAWGEDNDFDMYGLSQSQVTQLQSELARVRVECQHWRELAQQERRESNSSSSRLIEDSMTSVDLKEEGIQQQLLQQEREQHEREISALQSVHIQQIEAINNRHRQELEAMRNTATTVGGGGASIDGTVLVTANDAAVLKEKNEKLLTELSQLSSQNKQLVEKLQINQSIIRELREAINDLKQEVHSSQDKQLRNIESERKTLTSYISDIQSSFQSHQETIASLQSQQVTFERETRSLSNELDQLNVKLENKDSEISQISTLEESERLNNGDSTAEPLVSEIELLRERLAKEQEKRETLQSHLSEAASEHDRQLQDILADKSRLETRLAEVRNEHSSLTISSQREIDRLTLENQKLSQKLQDNERLQKENHLLRTGEQLKEENYLNRTVGQLQAQLNEAQTTSKDYLDQIGIYERELTDCKSRIRDGEENLNNLRSLLSRKEEELEARVKQSENLASEVMSLSLEQSQNRLQLATLQESLLHQSKTVGEEKLEHEREKETLIERLRVTEESLKVKEQQLIELNQTKETLATNFKQQLTVQAETIDQLTHELNNTQTVASTLKQEKDEKDIETETNKETEELQTKCLKYQKDLERLRDHLLQVEEHYTEEALKAEQRETQLRQELRAFGEEMMRANEQHSQEKQQNQFLIHQLQDELKNAQTERDRANQDLSSVQTQSEQNVTALNNLQSVLEHYQRELGGGSDQNEELRQLLASKQRELDSAHRECERLTSEQKELQSSLLTSTGGHEESGLQLELQQKDSTIKSLTSEVGKYQLTLNKCRLKIEQLSCDQDTNLDRLLVKNLFLRFLSTHDTKKREEIIHLFGKILDISSTELQQASVKKTGWLSSFWSLPAPPTPSVVTPTDEQKSFSQIFISFLESESVAPPPKPRAPPIPLPSSTTHPRPPVHILPLNQSIEVPRPPQTEEENTASSLEKLLDS